MEIINIECAEGVSSSSTCNAAHGRRLGADGAVGEGSVSLTRRWTKVDGRATAFAEATDVINTRPLINLLQESSYLN